MTHWCVSPLSATHLAAKGGNESTGFRESLTAITSGDPTFHIGGRWCPLEPLYPLVIIRHRPPLLRLPSAFGGRWWTWVAIRFHTSETSGSLAAILQRGLTVSPAHGSGWRMAADVIQQSVLLLDAPADSISLNVCRQRMVRRQVFVVHADLFAPRPPTVAALVRREILIASSVQSYRLGRAWGDQRRAIGFAFDKSRKPCSLRSIVQRHPPRSSVLHRSSLRRDVERPNPVHRLHVLAA